MSCCLSDLQVGKVSKRDVTFFWHLQEICELKTTPEEIPHYTAEDFSSNMFRWDESRILQVSKPLANGWLSCVGNYFTAITKYITTVGENFNPWYFILNRFLIYTNEFSTNCHAPSTSIRKPKSISCMNWNCFPSLEETCLKKTQTVLLEMVLRDCW